VRAGQPAAVLEQLLAGGLSVEYASGSGVRLLRLALESGHSEAAALLLRRGASVDAAGPYRWTALHSAAFGGLVAPLLLVLQRVPTRDRAPKDGQGWTPLNVAAFLRARGSREGTGPGGQDGTLWPDAGVCDAIRARSHHVLHALRR
jgi:hypothetical protein